MRKINIDLIPKKGGVYLWYSNKNGCDLLGLDCNKLTKKENMYLIYVGKINTSLQSRIKNHSDSEFSMNKQTKESNKFMLSTLRHSLGSILYGVDKPKELDKFMKDNFMVDFIVCNNTKEVEDNLIDSIPYLPLNLKGNKRKDSFHIELKKKRKIFKENTIKSHK